MIDACLVLPALAFQVATKSLPDGLVCSLELLPVSMQDAGNAHCQHTERERRMQREVRTEVRTERGGMERKRDGGV